MRAIKEMQADLRTKPYIPCCISAATNDSSSLFSKIGDAQLDTDSATSLNNSISMLCCKWFWKLSQVSNNVM